MKFCFQSVECFVADVVAFVVDVADVAVVVADVVADVVAGSPLFLNS